MGAREKRIELAEFEFRHQQCACEGTWGRALGLVSRTVQQRTLRINSPSGVFSSDTLSLLTQRCHIFNPLAPAATSSRRTYTRNHLLYPSIQRYPTDRKPSIQVLYNDMNIISPSSAVPVYYTKSTTAMYHRLSFQHQALLSSITQDVFESFTKLDEAKSESNVVGLARDPTTSGLWCTVTDPFIVKCESHLVALAY